MTSGPSIARLGPWLVVLCVTSCAAKKPGEARAGKTPIDLAAAKGATPLAELFRKAH